MQIPGDRASLPSRDVDVDPKLDPTGGQHPDDLVTLSVVKDAQGMMAAARGESSAAEVGLDPAGLGAAEHVTTPMQAMATAGIDAQGGQLGNRRLAVGSSLPVASHSGHGDHASRRVTTTSLISSPRVWHWVISMSQDAPPRNRLW